MSPPPDLVLAHEPSAAWFALRFRPTVVFSHGVERRGWGIAVKSRRMSGEYIRLRSRLVFPLWRLRQCDIALRKATALLVLNSEDYAYCQQWYGRRPDEIRLFRNGVHPTSLTEDAPPTEPGTVLFLGAWLPRKGVNTLIQAAKTMYQSGVKARWLLAGTHIEPEEVLKVWPAEAVRDVEVISSFPPEAEEALFARSSVFVLPSFFEGQPLSLLQAMAAGRCCLASRTCGQRDLIEHGVSGLLHEPGDSHTLASQIAECLREPERRRRFGRNAREAVRGRTWGEVAGEVAEFIERLQGC